MATKLDNKTPLGKLILKNLYLKGKNQEWLAEQIDVNPNHISVSVSYTHLDVYKRQALFTFT